MKVLTKRVLFIWPHLPIMNFVFVSCKLFESFDQESAFYMAPFAYYEFRVCVYYYEKLLPLQQLFDFVGLKQVIFLFICSF